MAKNKTGILIHSNTFETNFNMFKTKVIIIIFAYVVHYYKLYNFLPT